MENTAETPRWKQEIGSPPRTLVDQGPREAARPLEEFRCQACHRLLFRAEIDAGTVEIKCPKCGKMTTVGAL